MDEFFRALHDLGLATFIAFWVATSAAVYVDAKQRFERRERSFHLLVASLALPLAAPLVYLCVRPADTRLERREREATRRWLEAMHDTGERCLVCRTALDPSYLRCPHCAVEVRRPCDRCGAPVKLHWNACPHCESSLGEVLLPPLEPASRAA